MKDYDKSVKINHSPKQPYIPDHPFKILIIGGLWSGENNVLLNLIKHQRPDIDKILFTCQISTWIKVSITYQQKRKSRNYKTRQFKSIPWLFTNN